MTTEGEVLRPEDLFRTLGQIRKTAKPLEPLWGFLLYKKAITSIIGDPGIAKTTMCYSLATALCRGISFLDIYPEEPINAVYMDFESSDSLVMSRSNLILAKVKDIPNFYVYNVVDYFLPTIAHVLVQFCSDKKINLLVIDNQSFAFNTRDENDNAEAIRQMKILRQVTNACNTATVIVHHTSKANLPGTRKGSGAYARARLADICINADIPNEDYKDILQFEVVKNRMIDEKVLWYVKKEKGTFTITNPPLGVSGQSTNTSIYKAQKEILETMDGHDSLKFREIVDMLKSIGIDEHTVNNALHRLVQQGRLVRPKYGCYARSC